MNQEVDIYIDDDGYVCFEVYPDIAKEKVFWTLHSNGWEAFLPDQDDPCYHTYEHTFPTDYDLGEVRKIYQEHLNKK